MNERQRTQRSPLRACRHRAVATCTLFAFLAALVAPGSSHGKVRRAPARTQPTTVQTGVLRILCPVEGARFLIDEGRDGSVEGTTPAEDISLPVGSHTIRVSKEGYLPFSEVFDIEAGEVTELDVDMVLYSGRLRVEAGPPPVQVEVDGRELGTAPVEVELAIGEHVVRLNKPGYVEEVRRPQVRTGQTAAIEVTLVPVEVAARAASGSPVYKKWWFWTVAAVVVAGAVVPTVLLTRPKTRQATTPNLIELP